ncbi:retrovirus-related pol polyprotein from transposon TNT 1-94 [Tanacetum coccineum]
MSFVESSAKKAMDGSTIKVHGSTMPGSMSRTNVEIGTKHVFSPPMYSRSDFVITRKKLIHNGVDESKKPSLKPSLKSGNDIRKNGLYVMKLGNKSQDKLCLATVVDNSTLWHRRLSHANMHLIQSLSSKELVRNLPKLKYDKHFCDACKIGKQAHASHKAKNIVSTKRCLELLHMDLFGPSAIKSYGGNLYTLVVVDDYSSPPPTKLSPLVDDDVGEEEAIKKNTKVVNNNNEEDESIEVNEIVNIKESKNHPLDQVIGNLNQRTLRLESIRILLAIACANDFKLYQMDVKSAFLNGFINEEVYVAQPLGFIDFQKPNYVYKLKKALYGLKQAPKAWYDRLKAFLIKHEYSMGMVDNTLFTKKSKSRLIIVQIYVDDIIFGSTSQNLCDDFAKIMHDEFEMSMMGELNFFLGLQIKQIEDGIFFNQSKYIKEMLKKFGLEDSKPTKTPMSTEIKLTKDDEADSVDSSKYRENPKTTHLEAVKRIFSQPKGAAAATLGCVWRAAAAIRERLAVRQPWGAFGC